MTTELGVYFEDGDYHLHRSLQEARDDVAEVALRIEAGVYDASDYEGMTVGRRKVHDDEVGEWEPVPDDEVAPPPAPVGDLLSISRHDPNAALLGRLDTERADGNPEIREGA